MAQVRLILRDDVHNLGEAGDIVSVKPGYARNYLLPRGFAVLATESKVRELEHHRRAIAERQAKQLTHFESTKAALEKLELRTTALAGEDGRLFGSVTAAKVAALLAEQGFEVDRRKLQLSEPVKSLGEHRLALKLHRAVSAELRLVVEREGAPPEAEPEPDALDADDAGDADDADDATDESDATDGER